MKISTFDQYQAAYAQSVDDPEGFWAEIAQQFHWKKPWKKTLEWNFAEPSIKWFVGGTLNITENGLDRHLAERGDQPAIVWEPNDPDDTAVTITYKMLHDQGMPLCQRAQKVTASAKVTGCVSTCQWCPSWP